MSRKQHRQFPHRGRSPAQISAPALDPPLALRDNILSIARGSGRIFIVTVDITIAPGREAEFMPIMAAQAANSLANEGACHQFDICVDPDDPAKVMLYEVYDDKTSFDAHLATGHFKDFVASAGPLMAARTARTFHRVEP